MSRFPTTRLSLWLPGLATLAVAGGVAALLGGSLGARSWPLYLGLILAAIFVIGWAERAWTRRREAPAPPRSRGKLKVIRGGKGAYDLSEDNSTDDQKYMM